MIGRRLGHYEILAKLGEGGMGQVFRARDTRLDRDVAIKVLPAHLATDAAARARFEREAKAVAALSHPNILAIYDVGVEGDSAFVVMELLEGETLRERLSSASPTGGGSLPIRKATQIGTEIALGLAAAHDKQIVHRDIKPENIFVAADGRVKILDFGLARQTAPPGSTSSDSATELQRTDPGTVMGTVGYMAPEQVKGQPVDHRTDIFALGCVLHEMVAGQRPFARESAAETMSAILRDDPPDLTSRGTAIHTPLEGVVRHCLEKRPEERFQSARDLAFALQSLDRGSGSTAAVPIDAVVAAKPRRRGAMILGCILAAATAISAFLAGRAYGIRSEAGTAAYVESFQQVTDTPGVETWPTLSPDGKTLVYVSDSSGTSQIYSQRVGSRTSTPLTSGSANVAPAFSPDGERIAFWSSRDGGGIFVMSTAGESVSRVSDEGFAPAWSPKGDQLAVARANFISPADLSGLLQGLLLVDVTSGQKRELLKSKVALQPAWSPHGHRIAYFTLRTKSGQRDIETVAADGSETEGVEVTNDAALDWDPVWAPAGDYLYFSSNRGGTMNLWRVPIDERTGHTRGSPEPITTPANYSGWMSFSRDGQHLAYASLDWRSTLLRQNFDSVKEATVGPPTPLLKGSRPIRDHSISPDGQWVAFNEVGAQEDLFISRVDGREYRRLTDDPFRDRGPTWSPDSSTIYFYSDRGGGYDLWSIRPDHSHLEQHTKGSQTNFPVVSPDGRKIALSGVRSLGLTILDLGAPLDQKDAPEPAPGEGRTFWPFSWSNDGTRLVGIVMTVTGVDAGVMIYDVANKTYRAVPGAEDNSYAVTDWLRDGRRFLVRTTSGIWLVNSETGAKKMLTPVRGYFTGRSLAVSSDDRWYSYTETGTEGDVWIATLKR